MGLAGGNRDLGVPLGVRLRLRLFLGGETNIPEHELTGEQDVRSVSAHATLFQKYVGVLYSKNEKIERENIEKIEHP